MAKRVSLGNRGSRSQAVATTIVCLLAKAALPMTIDEMVERGWGLREDELPHFDYLTHGAAPDCENGRQHLHFHDLRERVRSATRRLKKLGLVADEALDYSRAKMWRITPEGEDWHREEAEEFAASVQADLEQLPVLA